MNFRSRLGLTVIVNLFLAGVSFGTSVLAARLFGTQGRGELTAIWIYPMLISTLALLGLPEALVYFTARTPEKAGTILSTCILTGLAISLPVMAATYLVLPRLLDAQTEATILFARLFLLFIPINALIGFISLSLRGKNDLGYWNITRIIPPLLWFFLLLVSILTAEVVTAGKLSSLYLLFLFISGILIMILVMRRVRGPFRPDFRALGGMLRYGLPALFASIPAMLNLRLDQLVMAGVIVPEKLGLYVTAVGYSGITISITSALASLIVPDIAGIVDESEKTRKMAHSLRLGSLIAGGMFVVLAALSTWLIPFFYGNDFSAAVPVAIILCLASGIAGINSILENGALGLGYPGYVFIAEITGFIITGVLLYFLIKPWQLYGAAVASVASYLMIMVIMLFMISRKTRTSVKELMIPTRNDIRWIFQGK